MAVSDIRKGRLLGCLALQHELSKPIDSDELDEAATISIKNNEVMNFAVNYVKEKLEVNTTEAKVMIKHFHSLITH